MRAMQEAAVRAHNLAAARAAQALLPPAMRHEAPSPEVPHLCDPPFVAGSVCIDLSTDRLSVASLRTAPQCSVGLYALDIIICWHRHFIFVYIPVAIVYSTESYFCRC